MAEVEWLSKKLLLVKYPGDNRVPASQWHYHWCPGCKQMHPFAVNQPFKSNNARWTFDGNIEAPTFSPSMHIEPNSPYTCHYFLRNGKLEFLNDCVHALAGQTVDLPDIPEEKVKYYV